MKIASTIFLLGALTVESVSTSLRGITNDKDVSWDFSKFKCMIQGFSDEDKCHETVNSEGNPCSFCTMDDGSGNKAGLCVDPQVAPTVENTNPQISCDNTESVDAIVDAQDYHDYKCSIKGFTDAKKCSHTHTDDGEKMCEYCSMGSGLGLCVSPEHVEQLKEASPSVKCSSQDTKESDEIASSPITDCNLSGFDIDTCLDPSKVNGSECIWCDAGIGGFCFPKTWADTAGHFLKCQEKPTEQKVYVRVE